MGIPGPAPKPYLQVVREGNPSKKPIEPGVVLPPAAEIDEPDWADTFPAVYDENDLRSNKRCRAVASREWRRVAPVLIRSSGLADVDIAVLQDYCIVVARIDQCERELSLNGLMQLGQRGWQKNGATTIVGQYRTQLRAYIGELGLSPSARTRLKAPEGGTDDSSDPFD